MITVAIPGERWEIEFLKDSSIEIEKFVSNGEISGEEALKDLFRRYQEHEQTWDLAEAAIASADELLKAESITFS